ncbi:peptidoglycan recognition protein [Streptomyces sp. NPDC013178]|uniref:peptidoglycan recognition protein family protein n=1 Tax=unclassified Streptomyces TaxID=2593676 RepID=UPI003402C23A
MRSRRIWGTAAAVAACVTGVLAFQGLDDDPAGGGGRQSGPVKASVQDIALKPGADGNVTVGQRSTKPFSLLGVSWTDPTAAAPGKVEARTREARSGSWSQWFTIGDNDALGDAPAQSERGATEPYWVGPSNGVQLRVTTGDKTSATLPKGLRLDLVDPGKAATADPAPAAYTVDSASPSPSDSPAVTDTPTDTSTGTATSGATPTDTATTATGSASPSASPSESSAGASPSASPSGPASTSPAPSASVPSGPPSTVPQPPIVSRAGWGADSTGITPEDPPTYDQDVKAVFVHHSDGTNDYSCADSASIVRGIYIYHVKSNGWNDIGYNFLVDKCGTIFEGRAGGVDRPVLGAHTYGWNRESAGIAVLGEYTSAGASQAALTSIARLAAWKLGQYGADPSGTTQLTSGATQKNYFGTNYTVGGKYTFNRISGHRDGYNTQCPGSALYAQLPTIRSWAAGPVAGLKLTSITGAGLSGSTYYTKAGITAHWSATTPASLISKFELLVDGKVAATAPGTATSASATLAVGTHQVAVRAVHQSGRTATSTAATVVAETTAPTFTTAPQLTLRTGTVNTTAAPVRLAWKATDNAALQYVKLLSPTTATYGPTTTTANLTAKPGTASTWSMRAYDYAGNYRASSPVYTPVILQETAAVRAGSWTTRSSTSYLGGKSYSSGSKGASLTWTFTGRSAAWVVSRATTSGQAYVYVDGAKVATVDLRSATTAYRDAIWTKSWSTSAKHTVKIVVVGTTGRPTITTDGLVYLK